jgi:hypothetical protein
LTGRASQIRELPLKVYESSVTDESPNGYHPDEDIPDDDWEGEEGELDFSNLFDAPDYSSFIKTKPNTKAKSYEARVASLMKAGLVGSINAGNFPDAATFIKHGPGFAKATGNLAAEDARIASIVDMITAPESPYVMFALVAIPLISQLMRNHKSEIDEAGSTFRQKRAQRKAEKHAGIKQPSTVKPIKVKIFRREWTVPIKVRFKFPSLRNAFKAFLSPTQHPQVITNEVLGDPRVQAELRKMGLYPKSGSRETE